jgi:transcriptional regulator with XRE-family HTH domain
MVTKSDIDERFRHNLIRLRRLRGLTQRELADKSGVNNIGQIESGARGAGKDAWARLATVLEVDISEFFRPERDDLLKPESALLRMFGTLTPAGRWFIVDVIKAFMRYLKSG